MNKPTAAQVLSRAAVEVGTKENPAGSNRVKYNTWYYARVVSGALYAWCAVFVSWVFAQFNALGLIFGKFNRTDTKAKWFASRRLYHRGVEGLRGGDIVFFHFHGDNYQGRFEGIHHTGFYTGKRTKDGRFATIEANTSLTSNDNGGAVMVRYRAASSIAGYVRPAYAEPKKTSAPKKTNPPVKPKPRAKVTERKPVHLNMVLRKGSRGSKVESLQRELKRRRYKVGAVDGIFGSQTEAAVKSFQRGHKLTVDGVVGKATALALGWKWAK